MDGEKYSQTEIDSNNKKGYNLDFSENGVFLQVFPRDNDEVLFELNDITNKLEERGIK